MPKLTGPLLSLLASGKLQTGLQIAIRPTGVFLTRTHTPTTTYTRRQKELRTFSAALTRAWSTWPPVYFASWVRHPRARARSPYHAFLWENHFRRSVNLWPLMIWDVTPTGAAPVIGSATMVGSSHRLSALITSHTGILPCTIALNYGEWPGGGATPLNVNAWSCETPAGHVQHHILRVQPGTYSMYILAVDVFGRPSNAKGYAGITVTD